MNLARTVGRLAYEAWTTDKHNDALTGVIIGGLIGSAVLFAMGFLLRAM